VSCPEENGWPLRLLAEAGYEGVSIAQVARLAGTARTGLYRRFPGKQDFQHPLSQDCGRGRVLPVTRLRSWTMYGSHIGPRLKLTPTFSWTSVSSSHVTLEASPTPSSSSLVKQVML
jgi:hypothetical protein